MGNSAKKQNLEDDWFLEPNAIGAIWHICFIANSFVFPIYAKYDKEYGITRMEFVVLFVLSQREGLMALDICRMTGLPKNNISRGVNKLIAKGLIDRERDTKDARRAHLSVTEKGKELYSELIVSYADRAARVLSPLNKKDRADLERIVLKVVREIPSNS